MDSDQMKSPPIKEKSSDREELTIMVIGSVGKVRSFKISRRAVLWISLFLFAYILASIYIFNRFFDLRYLYRIQTEKLEQSERELNENARMLLQTKEYAAGLEDYLKGLSDSRSLESLPDEEEVVTGRTVDTVVADSDKENGDRQETINNVDSRDAIIQEQETNINKEILKNSNP